MKEILWNLVSAEERNQMIKVLDIELSRKNLLNVIPVVRQMVRRAESKMILAKMRRRDFFVERHRKDMEHYEEILERIERALEEHDGSEVH